MEMVSPEVTSLYRRKGASSSGLTKFSGKFSDNKLKVNFSPPFKQK